MKYKTILASAAAIFVFCLAGLNLAAGRSDVADAAMKGDKAAVRALLERKADVNAPQVDGAVALHWAVYKDDIELADMLLRAGAKPDVVNREGITPLHMASLYGDVKMMDRLLEAGGNPNRRGPAGETMLMLAARNGNPEAITLLIRAGVDVNTQEPIRGTTALMWAAEQKHPAAVRALLDAKADPAIRSAGAGLPRNYLSPKVNTAAVEAAARRHMTAAASARTYEQQLAIEGVGGRFGGTDRTRVQARQPAGAGQRGQRGAAQASPENTPADDQGDQDFIYSGLVGTGGGGLTALVLASREGDLESAKLLLSAGGGVNQTKEDGWAPLPPATNQRHYTLAGN